MRYSTLFVFTALAALLVNGGRLAYPTIENGYSQNKVKPVTAFLVFLPIIIFVCTSNWRYWTDYPVYLSIYHTTPTESSAALAYLMEQKNSYLFYAFGYVIKVLSNDNEMFYRIALVLVQSIPLIAFFRKYSTNYVYSIYLILATALPLGWMLNGVRQIMAAAIIYGAAEDIIQKRYVKVTLIILLASLFHQSAIVALPMVFFCQGQAWSRKTMLALLGTIVLTIVFSSSEEAFTNIAVNVGYNAEILALDNGASPLRALIAFVPVLLAFLGREEISRDGSPAINFFVNMSVINFGIYLVAIVTNGVLVGRIPLYTSLYTFVLLPYLFEKVFNGSLKGVFYIFSIMLYGVFYLFEIGMA